MEDTYKGYTIRNEYGHYTVTSPTGKTWTVDTYEEAEADIDEIEAQAE